MRRAMPMVMLCALLLALVVSTGCTRVQRYAAGGGLIGAAIGGPIAANVEGARVCCGVAVGLVTGGLIGALVGDAVDKHEGTTRGVNERGAYEENVYIQDQTTPRGSDLDRSQSDYNLQIQQQGTTSESSQSMESRRIKNRY